MKQKLLTILFIASVSVFTYHAVRYGLSSFTVGWFDEPLRILAHQYATQGLELYKDVGVVYPPGSTWLIGKIIPFQSIFQRNFLFTIGTVFLLFAALLQVKSILQCAWVDIRLSLFICIGAIYLMFIPSEPFSWSLLLLLFTVYVKTVIKKGPILTQQLSLIAFAIPFFRWDHELIFLMGQAVGIICLYLISRWKHEMDLKPDRAWRTLLPIGMGYMLGIVAMVLVFVAKGTGKDAYEFIVHIPSQVIMEYRKLPLPRITSPRILNASLYLSLFAWIGISLAACTVQKNRGTFFLLLLLPFSFLPYATGRADWPHAVPLLITISLVMIFATKLIESKKTFVTLGMILVLPMVRLLIPTGQSLSISPNREGLETEKSLYDCERISHTIDPKSIFVGRQSYRRFITNAAALYLVKPTVKPATRYISDEPGIQNDCSYGAAIVYDLTNAPKPMLAFIELGEQKVEPNKTQTMESCGVIESYLQQAPYTKVGSCSAYNQTFDIRVYP